MCRLKKVKLTLFDINDEIAKTINNNNQHDSACHLYNRKSHFFLPDLQLSLLSTFKVNLSAC